MNHAGALGDTGYGHRSPRQLDPARYQLRAGIGGHDRLGRLRPAGLVQPIQGRSQARQQPLDPVLVDVAGGGVVRITAVSDGLAKSSGEEWIDRYMTQVGLPEDGTTVLYARPRRVIESSRITTSRLCSTSRLAFSMTISAT